MPVFGYLAYPVKGAKHALQHDFETMPYCDVMPAENEEVLVLVTDTPNEDIEKDLKEKLAQMKNLQSLGMTFGHVAD